jgi:hypothetical protein
MQAVRGPERCQAGRCGMWPAATARPHEQGSQQQPGTASSSVTDHVMGSGYPCASKMRQRTVPYHVFSQ